MDQKNNHIIFKLKSFPQISETFVVANIVEAIKKGYSVTIITDKINPIAKSSQEYLFKKYQLLEKTIAFKSPTGSNRKAKALQILLRPKKLYYFLKLWQLRKKKSLDYIFLIQFYWNYRNAKIIHVHFATAINPLFDLKKIGLLKSKIIVTFHGYDAHFLPEGNSLKRLLENFNTYVSRITVNSTYLKEKLVAKGFNKNVIEIIPIGFDETVFQLKKSKNFNNVPFKIISVGRLVTLKGHDFGIKAIFQLKEMGFDISYTIVGTGAEYDNLLGLIKRLNLENQVFLLGSKSQLEIKELLENHHLFLMTSTKDESGRSEAFGVVSLEAQAMGLPIVGFNAGGFPDTVLDGETGFLVEDKNIKELSNKIATLINDEKLLKQMSTACIAHVNNKFNTKHTTGKYLDLYEQLY